ncbi:hypothetical protein BH10ACI4_BH10ACI4_23150 [soil metagenome]
MRHTLLNVSVTLFALMFSASVFGQILPSGTRLAVRLDATVSSSTARVGDIVPASLAEDLVVENQVLARRGHPLRGRVTFARRSGRFHKPGYITVRLDSIEIDGRRYDLSSSAIRDKGNGHLKSNATKIGGGAGIGALIGAIAGGGKGALIGGLVGAGAGTGVAAATGRHSGELPAESLYAFTLLDQSRPR